MGILSSISGFFNGIRGWFRGGLGNFFGDIVFWLLIGFIVVGLEFYIACIIFGLCSGFMINDCDCDKKYPNDPAARNMCQEQCDDRF